jgi:hypothetical protein
MKPLVRKTLLAFRKLPLLIENRFDRFFLSGDVPEPENVSHRKWQKYLMELGNQPGMRILEIGSREVTGRFNYR